MIELDEIAKNFNEAPYVHVANIEPGGDYCFQCGRADHRYHKPSSQSCDQYEDCDENYEEDFGHGRRHHRCGRCDVERYAHV